MLVLDRANATSKSLNVSGTGPEWQGFSGAFFDLKTTTGAEGGLRRRGQSRHRGLVRYDEVYGRARAHALAHGAHTTATVPRVALAGSVSGALQMGGVR